MFIAITMVSVAGAIVLALLVYRDVEKRNGDGAKVAIAVVLFWPLGVYWWHKARQADRERRPPPPTGHG